MKKLLVILTTVIFLPGCDLNCSSSASCAPPPDGTFTSEAVNIAVSESILEEFEPSSYRSVGILDSVIVNTSVNEITILDFYQWAAIAESSIASIDIYYEEKSENLVVADFLFENTESTFTAGGYLLTFIKSSGETQLQIVRASQDLVDGVCNDTIDC